MKRAAFCFLFVSLLASVEAYAQTPHASAVFSSTRLAPAFMIECPNTSAAPLSAVDLKVAFKIDGKEAGGSGGGGSVGGGQLQPGQSWKIKLELYQGSSGPSDPDLGARLSITYPYTLTAGRHVIAFRCAGNWTEEIEFYWNRK